LTATPRWQLCPTTSAVTVPARAGALPVTEEAVKIRRMLAAASPDRYRPDLAASLNNLSTLRLITRSVLGARPSCLHSSIDKMLSMRLLAAC
jgi:hypothetical protein